MEKLSVKLGEREIEVPLTIGNFRSLFDRGNIAAFISEVLTSEELDIKSMTLAERSEVERSITVKLQETDQKAKEAEQAKVYRSEGWNGYTLPSSMEETTIEQELDFKDLWEKRKKTLEIEGEIMSDWDVYPILLAVYCRKDGEEYSSDLAEQRCEIMDEAPFGMAVTFSAFFFASSEDTMRVFAGYFPIPKGLTGQGSGLTQYQSTTLPQTEDPLDKYSQPSTGSSAQPKESSSIAT